MNRDSMLRKIRKNIRESGFHIYGIDGGPSPRYFYTIGISEVVGFEILFAGGYFFETEDAAEMMSCCAKLVVKDKTSSELAFKRGKNACTLALRCVDRSWQEITAYGVADYYEKDDIPILQLVPENKFSTLDVPDMSLPFEPNREPAWQWLVNDWQFEVPEDSTAITNLDALRGKTLTEVVRWEDNTWAIFSGTGQSQSKVRQVPIGVLLARDSSLGFLSKMKVDDGFWREPGSKKWNVWDETDKS